MYRPEGWNNPYELDEPTLFTEGERIKYKIASGAFEDGADTMLEALKKEGICSSKVYYNGQFGSWLQVFIPKGGHEGKNPL